MTLRPLDRLPPYPRWVVQAEPLSGVTLRSSTPILNLRSFPLDLRLSLHLPQSTNPLLLHRPLPQPRPPPPGPSSPIPHRRRSFPGMTLGFRNP